MKTEVASVQSWTRKLDVEVPAEEFSSREEKAIAAFQKKVHIDGFRKGKVPLALVRQRFAEAMKADVSEALAVHFLRQAIEENGLFPVATPVIQKLDYEEGVRLTFSAEMEVEPDIELRDYRGLKIEKELVAVTKDDVRTTIESLRDEHASLQAVEGGAGAGHVVEGDIQALESSGIPVIGRKWENRGIELGESPLGKLVQDQLLGVKAGEERRFKVVEPERGPDGRMREQEKHYLIKVKSVKEKTLPVLGDDFAKQVGNFESIPKMEEGILHVLEVSHTREAEEALEQRIIAEIIRRNDFDLPPSMIENALSSLYEDEVRRTGQNPDQAEFRKSFLPMVQRTLKWDILWHKIAATESLSIGEDEVGQWIEKAAEADPKNEKRIRALYKDEKRRNRLKENLLNQKVLQRIKEHAHIKEVAVKSRSQAPPSIIAP